MREKHDGDTISLTLPISFSLCLSIYLSIYRFLVSIYIISIFYTFTLSLMYKKKTKSKFDRIPEQFKVIMLLYD